MNIDHIVAGCLEGGKRRVVIPGFGALIRRQSGELVFVDIFNTDDGVLCAELERQTGLGRDEARKAVDKYSFHLKTELLYNKKAEIAGVGTIIMTADGSYEIVHPAGEPAAAVPEPETYVAVAEEERLEETAAVDEIPAEPGGRADEAGTSPEPGGVTEEKPAESEIRAEEKTVSSVQEIFAEEKQSGNPGNPFGASIPVFVSAEESDVPEEEEPTAAFTDGAGTRPEPVGYTGTPEQVEPSEPVVLVADATGPVVSEGGETPAEGQEEKPEPEEKPSGHARRDVIREILYGEGDVRKPEDLWVDGGADDDGEKVPVDEYEHDLYASPEELKERKELELIAKAEREAEDARNGVRPVTLRKPKRKRVDPVIVIAIIAMLVAAAILIYGEVTKPETTLYLQEMFDGN